MNEFLFRKMLEKDFWIVLQEGSIDILSDISNIKGEKSDQQNSYLAHKKIVT